MRFGKTLKEGKYQPWADQYIDYAKLKSVLRDDRPDDDDDTPWTDDDEKRFCDEVLNVQLEKVAAFQADRMADLSRRVDASFERLKDLAPLDGQPVDDATAARLRQIETELDGLTDEVTRLKRYSSLNYTGFLKIVKKHDRKRGDRYRFRPMMQMSLSQRPFNSEQAYTPILKKLGMMYFAARQQLDEEQHQQQQQHTSRPVDLANPGETHDGERYTAYKFWVHPENLVEVKTIILRRLPALVYSPHASSSNVPDEDPTVTSLYFDNPAFELYTQKVERKVDVSSVRLRWFGQLSKAEEVVAERKMIDADGSSHEEKFSLKDKHVKSYLDGEHTMEKAVQRLGKTLTTAELDRYKATVRNIRDFIREKGLSPVIRANCVRTAFQKPSDSRIRISIDTDLAFVREDTLDPVRPCRDPAEWHRSDIDANNWTYPFAAVDRSELSRFPHAVLEIKLREDANRKRPAWIEDLMSSHLVHTTPSFSKFVHGVASLFEDHVNALPFWLGDLETDIRKDPQKAYEEEEHRRAQRAEEESLIGSFLGAKSSSQPPQRGARSSPAGMSSYMSERLAAERRSSAEATGATSTARTSGGNGGNNDDDDDDDDAIGEDPEGQEQQDGSYGTFASVLPSFSLRGYAQRKRMRQGRQRSPELPEGVTEPTEWIKNMGELKVEPKVWLANERTFFKWQHISILLAGLSVGLYTAAGEDTVATAMGVACVLIAGFASAWGYGMLHWRRILIVQRSGKDFDNMWGPMVVSVALAAALMLNFGFKWRATFGQPDDHEDNLGPAALAGGTSLSVIGELV